MSKLVTRNVTIGSHRTSVRLEPALWQALDDICAREGTSLNRLCTQIAGRPRSGGFTSALRVYIVHYYQALASASRAA